MTLETRRIGGDHRLWMLSRAVTAIIAARRQAVAAADARSAARASCSHSCRDTRRRRLRPPLVYHTAGSRRRCPPTGHRRSRLKQLQPPPSPKTLIPRGLGSFYRRPGLVRLNQMHRLAYVFSSY
jgi:hypothetical protein